MSIVERAVEKSQSDDKKTSVKPPAVPPHVNSTVTHEAVQHKTLLAAPYDAAYHDASVTARDLKAIVQLDSDRLRELGRLPSVDGARQVDEEIRRVKWPLLSSIAGRNGSVAVRNNVILVTSALPGEGKTFMSLNLALSIVRDREMRVILVDGDVARPGLTPALGLEGRPGLNDVLEDADRQVSTVTYQTSIDGLFVVPAGKWHAQAPEFFAGSRMPKIIGELTRRVGNGVIVIDSPPLLATNEAQVVTRYVGQVLLVVRADSTEQRAVVDAIALVDKSTPVNAVLNCVRPSVLGRYYGQYDYGYGYGDGHDTARAQRSKGKTHD